MDYDITRAHILLRDLERIARSRAPAVQFEGTATERPLVRGTCTRSGLLMLAVRLAKAALTAQGWIGITAEGTVFSDGVGGIVEVQIAEELPQAWRPVLPWWQPWWLTGIFIAGVWILLALAAIGFATVAGWLRAL